MKKITFLLTVIGFILLISGCTNKDTIKVMVPSGGPTYAFLNMMQGDDAIEYENVSGTDLLVAAVTSKSHQIVVLPTNLGAKLYNEGSGYVYAGTITFGNLFLVSSNQNKTINDIEGEKILVFGKGSTPDIILQKLLAHNQLLDKVELDYVNDVNEALAQFKAGNYNYVLLAEPVLSIAKKSNEVNLVLDLQSAYGEMTGKDYYPQAGVFIEKEFAQKNNKFVKSFLNNLEKSIDFLNNNNQEAADFYVNNENLLPRIPKDVVVNSIPNSNVKFKNVSESKELLNIYYQMLYEFNSKTIGDKLPDDNFYLNF